jgi:DNA-binding transcriptional regulator YdaS (Cro superfamily)
MGNIMKRSPPDIDLLRAVCKVAVMQAGGATQLSRKIGITSQAVGKWAKHRGVPPSHVLAVEKLSGIDRHVLRPDVYGKAPKPVLEENGAPA